MVRLYRDRKYYTDGVEHDPTQQHNKREHDEQHREDRAPNKYEEKLHVFDYESVIIHQELVELRSKNLITFMSKVFEDIIIKNVDASIRAQNQHKCKHFFSSEIMLLTLKGYNNLKEKTNGMLKKLFPGNRFMDDKHEYKEKEKFFDDQLSQFVLRILFEDLCLRLQHLKPHDVIRIVGFKEYENSPILNVNNHKRNNFYFIGVALR